MKFKVGDRVTLKRALQPRGSKGTVVEVLPSYYREYGVTHDCMPNATFYYERTELRKINA